VLTILSPAVMIYLLAFGSGKKVLERSMKKRPGYEDYVRRTSGFFPLPPKK
jgi:steroid 5-alpha reductase family enzyme